MAQSKKTDWKLFINESVVLVLHLTLAVFFCRIAVSVHELYHATLPAVAAAIISACFLIPLSIHVIDLWARLLAAVREEAFAVKLLDLSIGWHKKLFGENNAFMSEKQAILGDVYYSWGKPDEARKYFDAAWHSFENSKTKFPPLHPAMQDYCKLLIEETVDHKEDGGETEGAIGSTNPETDAIKAAETGDTSAKQQSALVQKELVTTKKWLAAQRAMSFLVTIPTILFMVSMHALELEISAKNSEMHPVDSLKGINALSKLESAVLGEYAAALVFADYAGAFEDAGQYAEMVWCVNKSIDIMQQMREPDPVLTLTLLNQKSLGLLLTNKTDEARKTLQAALKLSGTISDSTPGAENWPRQNKIRKEQEKAEMHLAELERLDGNYAKAEKLYLKACGLKPDMTWDEQAQSKEKSAQNTASNKDQVSTGFSRNVMYATKVVDALQLIDRLHKLQHIETKLDQPKKTLEIQKRICELLDRGYSLEQLDGKTVNESDFSVRESARELDVCSLMLAEAGHVDESKKYRAKAEALRNKHSRTLKLDAGQQDSLVDICTRVTNGLLAAKYRPDNWKDKFAPLVNRELSTKGAQFSLSRLPWYDRESLKKDSPQKSKIGKLEVNISPLSIRNSADGSGIAVDVQGSVKIYSREKSVQDPEEQKFNFAYLVKDMSKDHAEKPVIEGFLDNQPTMSFQLD